MALIVCFALMAIGGYGRATVHPQSDVDLLFFFKDTIDEEAIKAILHPLWDLQFKVGHQIRNADDLKDFDEGQIESYTAFLDCRLIVGDPPTALEFEREIMPRLLQKNRNRILKLLADGLTLKEIASQLNLSVKTVDAHKYNLMRKLDLHDRSELIKYAIQRKLIHLPTAPQ